MWSDNNSSEIADDSDAASGPGMDNIKVKTTTSVVAQTNGPSYLLDDLNDNGRKSAMV